MSYCTLPLPVPVLELEGRAVVASRTDTRGRLGVSELAAASLANMVIYGSFVMVTGLANALTTLSSNAVGAGNMKKVGLWLQVAIVW